MADDEVEVTVHSYDETRCDRAPMLDGDLCGHGYRAHMAWYQPDDVPDLLDPSLVAQAERRIERIEEDERYDHPPYDYTEVPC